MVVGTITHTPARYQSYIYACIISYTRPKTMNITDQIIKTVSEETGVTKNLLMSKRRNQFIVDSKQIVIFALTQLGFTQQFIAEQLNYKDHTTIHHHLKRDCPISHENRRRATRVVRQCDYMASIEKSRYESNMEEFLERVQQIR